MTSFHSEHVFHRPWEEVTRCHWKKYPNPHQPHVLGVEVFRRFIDATSLHPSFTLRRVLVLQYGIPSWINSLLGGKCEGYAVEDCFCDGEKKILKLTTRNFTFRSLFKGEEVCVYSRHPENPKWTLYIQDTRYEILKFGKIVGRMMEKMAATSSKEQYGQGVSVIEELLRKTEKAEPP